MRDASIERHYAESGLADTVLQALEKVLGGTDVPRLEDLPPVDELHIRGREATFEMIHNAQFSSDDHVLDVGCGVGGPSRWLAQMCGCRVSGLDITEAFCKVATLLARHTGLEKQVKYYHGSALDIPFEEDYFDGVWMQHVNMNIEDKSHLFSECRRVLRPGGKLVFYEIITG